MSLAARSLGAALSISFSALTSSMAAAQTPASIAPAEQTAQTRSVGGSAFARTTLEAAVRTLTVNASGTTQQPVAASSARARAIGTEVRVTSITGSVRKGVLVSLSTSEVVLRTGEGDAVIPLAEVYKVERPSRGASKGAGIGLLAGLGLGGLMWAIAPCEGDCPPGADVFGMAMMAGIGGGVGALIGRVSAKGEVIYENSARSTVQHTPMPSPTASQLHRRQPPLAHLESKHD